jgi:hypothetical protein
MNQDSPRAYTPEEVREKLLNHFCHLISYWNGEGDSNVSPNKTSREKMEGLVFSILACLDGCNGDFPAFNLSPAPHSTDKDFYKKNNENWYDSNIIINEVSLHELWHDALRNQPRD